MKAIILAAGHSDKLYPLTKKQPKILLPIIGRPLISYLLDEIENLWEIDEVFLVTNETFVEQFETWKAENTLRQGLEITIINNKTTGDNNSFGAIADLNNCLKFCEIDEDTLVIAGDSLVQFDLSLAMNEFNSSGYDLVCGQRAKGQHDLSRFGVAKIDSENFIIEFTEKPHKAKSNLIIYGIYFLKRSTLALVQKYLDEMLIPEHMGSFIEWLYPQKPIKVHLFEGECIDIDTHADYAEAQLKLSNSNS